MPVSIGGFLIRTADRRIVVDLGLARVDFATEDDDRPRTHFVSLQRSIADFNATRAVMNAADARTHHSGIGARHHNGINAFVDVQSRATFAVPARARRSYPYLQR